MSVLSCCLTDPPVSDVEAMDCSDQGLKENNYKGCWVTFSHYSLDDTSSVGIMSVNLDSVYMPDFEVEPNDKGSLYGRKQGHSTRPITLDKSSFDKDSVVTKNKGMSPVSRH